MTINRKSHIINATGTTTVAYRKLNKEVIQLASIKDVAEAAGVSTSTVSRIINDNPAISTETRERVQKVMKELNYVPNSMARGLSNQRAFTVTLAINADDVKSFNNPFFYEVMHGIETVVYQKDLCLIVANMQTFIKKESILSWLINGKRTQGIIFPSSIVNEKMIRELKKHKFPFVVFGEPGSFEPVDWVDINNRQGGQQAVEHLLQQGYSKIAFISGSKKEVFNKNRHMGYRDGLERNGLTYLEEYVAEGGSAKSDGYNMMHALLTLEDRPDAIICSDNILSLGVMKAILSAGFKIPEDIGVISFDNFPVADLADPPLTTVDVDVFELGVQAANMLFKLIENPQSRQQQSLIATEIQMRQSTQRKK